MKKSNKKIQFGLNNNVTCILILILFTIISSLFLFKNGLIVGHDLEYHLSRISSISNLFKNGDFLALIHDGVNGFGYANGFFYSNIFLYLPALMVLLGVDLILSYKIYIVVLTFLTGLSMFVCTKKIFKNNVSSLISAVIYMTCSYRICDVMVRAALGEVLAFAIIPIVFLGLYYILFEDYKKFYVFSIGFVLLINAHLISTLLMMFTCVFLIVLNIKKLVLEKKRLLYLILSGCLGILLGAFFIIPMFEFYSKNNLIIKNSTDQSMLFFNFNEIFSGIPKYTTRFVAPGIGFLFIYLLILRIFIKKDKKSEFFKFYDSLIIVSIILLLCSSNILPWNEISKWLGFIQFTWRLFVPVCAGISFVSGWLFYLYVKDNEYKNYKVFVLLVFTLISCLFYQYTSVMSLKTYHKSDEAKYIYNYTEFEMGAREYLPVGVDERILFANDKSTYSNNDVEVNVTDYGSKLDVNFYNNSGEDTYIDLPQIYYIGYKAKDDNNYYYQLSSGYSKFIRLYIGNKKEGHVTVFYRGTKILILSYFVSIISWISFIVILSIYERRKNK